MSMEDLILYKKWVVGCWKDQWEPYRPVHHAKTIMTSPRSCSIWPLPLVKNRDINTQRHDFTEQLTGRSVHTSLMKTCFSKVMVLQCMKQFGTFLFLSNGTFLIHDTSRARPPLTLDTHMPKNKQDFALQNWHPTLTNHASMHTWEGWGSNQQLTVKPDDQWRWLHC